MSSLIDRWWDAHERDNTLPDEEFEAPEKPVRKNAPARKKSKKSLLDRLALATRTTIGDKYGDENLDVAKIPLLALHQFIFDAGADSEAVHDFTTAVDSDVVEKAADSFLESGELSQYLEDE